MRLVPMMAAAAVAGSLFTGCSGGSTGNPANNGAFVVNLISTGQGQIFPYQIPLLDGAGDPSDTIINIESMDTLQNNIVRGPGGNTILPVAAFPATPTLPNGDPGNHYIQMTFSNELDVESILSTDLGDFTTNSGLTSAVSLIARNPDNESTMVLQGQGFVGGVTFFNRGGLQRVEAVGIDEDTGEVVINDIEASGFPTGFNGDTDLVQSNTFVFVADIDNNLDTIDSFDPFDEDVIIEIRIRNTILNSDGDILEMEAGVATTVGPDPNPADILGFMSGQPRIFPGNGEGSVDPTAPIILEFNKPVQPGDVGQFFDSTNLVPDSGGVTLNFEVNGADAPVLYYADPISFADFTQFVVTPAFVLPGRTTFNIGVIASAVRGLTLDTLGNDVETDFTTGAGPGIVNAPVAPDAIYVGFGGANPGVSVIDLNGYGQTTNGLDPDPITGEPTQDPNTTRFADNPNIGNVGVLPSLSPGTGPIDAGSDGLFSLVEDTSGNTNLLGAPLVGDVTDIHVGAPLDLVFNNSNINPNAGSQNQTNPATLGPAIGNTISVRPNPNPPKLVFPPENPSRAIFGEEPAVASSMPVPMGLSGTMIPGCEMTALSQLTQSSRLDFQVGVTDGVFVGPQRPVGAPPIITGACPFLSRQQIGHFLYVLDADNNQILVVNSNRFTVLDTIQLSDPVAMTMSPSLGLLAVSNFSSSTVSFVNIDPRSPFFNTIVGETLVADGPSAIAWQPDGEHALVVSGPSNALTVLSANDFSIVAEASGSLSNPIDIAVTQRYVNTGNTAGIYYGYVLNANGTIAVYESGPDGVNGIGFRDVTGLIDVTFPQARRLRLNYLAAQGGVYVAHVDDLGVGVVSSLELTSSPQGPQPTQQNSGGFVLPPTFRQKVWTVEQTFGGSDPSVPNNQRLTGNSPVDMTTDEVLNFGGNTNQITNFNPGVGQSIIGHSSKGHSLLNAMGANVTPFQPRFLFVALSDVGAVDVFDLDTRVRVASIDVPGVSTLSGYWKQ
ncbi:MAG: hypothetical protein AAF196_16155 [Planctomycetota bacterium]